MFYLTHIPDLIADKIWIKGQRIEDSKRVTDQNIIWWGAGEETDESMPRY